MAAKTAKKKKKQTATKGKTPSVRATKSASTAGTKPRGKKVSAKVTKKKAADAASRKAPAKTTKRTKRKAATPTETSKPGKVARAAKKRPAAKRSTKKSRRSRKTAKELSRFRELLMRKQQDLLQSYSSAKGDSRARQADGTEDYIDYAVSSYDREFLLSLTELDQKELLLVEEALKRVVRGDFGHCQQCGQEVPSKRLEVQPWARYCVRCQELAEQGLLTGPAFGDVDDDEADEESDDDLDLEPEEEAELKVDEELPAGDSHSDDDSDDDDSIRM